jgi:hypothetical protein
MTRFDEATVRDAEQVSAPRPASQVDARRAHLVEKHGPIMGPVLHEAEVKAIAEAREKFLRLKAQHDVVQSAIALRREEQQAELEPYQRRMDESLRRFTEASAAFEQKRIENQSALVPLEQRALEIISAMNEPLPGFGWNIPQQWRKVDV